MARIQYADNPYGIPVVEASVDDRVAFLRKVAGLSFVGLMIAGVTAMLGMGVLVAAPSIFGNQLVAAGIMLGALFAARGVGGFIAGAQDRTTQLGLFVAGTALQGVAMSYLFLSAILVSMQAFAGNPFILLGEALGLTGLTVAGMCVYLLTGPKNLNWIGGILAATALPMTILMVVSFVWPSLFGGVIGLLLNTVFIFLSAGGLLYSMNKVIHEFSTNMWVAGSYFVTMGILTLFWNILTLLMRLQSRD